MIVHANLNIFEVVSKIEMLYVVEFHHFCGASSTLTHFGTILLHHSFNELVPEYGARL